MARATYCYVTLAIALPPLLLATYYLLLERAAISALSGGKAERTSYQHNFPPRQVVVKTPLGLFRFQDAAAYLIALDRFKQRLEIAFAEAFIAFTLDKLEKHRTQGGC